MTTTTISEDRLLITKAKRKAAEWMPFLQSVFMPMRCTPTPKVPTAAVDQYGRMYYNPAFFSKLSVEVVAYVILHECLHCVLSHHKRTQRMCPNLDAQKAFLANIAQDLCIQQALAQQIGVHEPDGIVTIPRWQHVPGITAGRTSEQYFEALCAWQASKPKAPPPPPPPQPSEEEDEEENEDEEQDNHCTPTPDDDSDTTDDAEDGDSEQDSDDEYQPGDGEGDSEDGEQDSASDGQGSGEGESDSDGGGEGEGESSSSDGEAGGEGGSGQTQLDTDGMPEMGEVCNPAHAGSGSDGVAKEWEEEPTLADVSNMEKRLRDAETALDEMNPCIGSGAGMIRQSLKARLHPQPDPFDQLKHVVARSIASPVGTPDLTYRKYPRRTLPGAARLRGVQRLQPEATILLDTSGSMMSNDIMARALAVVAKGISRLQNPRVVCCDGAIQSAKRIANMSNFQWDGGGGTDMAAGLIHVDKTYKPDSIVIITDGITYWPNQPTRARVICALCCPDWAAQVPKWITTVHLYRTGSQYVL